MSRIDGRNEGGRTEGGRTEREARRGLTMIEVVVALAVLVVAVVGALGALSSTALVGESTPERTRAQFAAQQMLERLRGVPIGDVFALYNSFPGDDPMGPGSAPGSTFAIPGLDPQDGEAAVGTLLFPTPAGRPDVLRENLDAAAFAMPLDLDGDGEITGGNVALTYVQLPVRVRARWTGAYGDQELEYDTILGSW